MNVREYPNLPEHDLVITLTDSNLPDSNPFFLLLLLFFCNNSNNNNIKNQTTKSVSIFVEVFIFFAVYIASVPVALHINRISAAFLNSNCSKFIRFKPNFMVLTGDLYTKHHYRGCFSKIIIYTFCLAVCMEFVIPVVVQMSILKRCNYHRFMPLFQK